MLKIWIISLTFILSGCTAADALGFLKGATDKGGINTQIGDRANTLGESSSIDTIKAYKGGTVQVDQSKPGFSGNAETVVINDTNWGILIGIALFFWALPSIKSTFKIILGKFHGRPQ